MNPFTQFPNAVIQAQYLPASERTNDRASTTDNTWHDCQIIIDNSQTLNDMNAFGVDGDVLIYMRPPNGDNTLVGYMSADLLADGEIRYSDIGVDTYHNYRIVSVAYGRDQDTGGIIDFELTCKPEGMVYQ